MTPLRSSVKSGFDRPAASVYAVFMSRTAAVNLVGFLMLHGAGPAVVTDKTNPLTSVQVRRSAAPVIGLVPTSPVTAEVGTSVMPASVRITKSPAVRRFTGAGPGPAANALPATARSAIPAKYLFLIMLKKVGEYLQLALGNVAHSASNCDACVAHASLKPKKGSISTVPAPPLAKCRKLRSEEHTSELQSLTRHDALPICSSLSFEL